MSAGADGEIRVIRTRERHAQHKHALIEELEALPPPRTLLQHSSDEKSQLSPAAFDRNETSERPAQSPPSSGSRQTQSHDLPTARATSITVPALVPSDAFAPLLFELRVLFSRYFSVILRSQIRLGKHIDAIDALSKR